MNIICAGFVTYNPKIELFREALESIRYQVKEIVIVDNYSDNIDELAELVSVFDNITLIRNNKNQGIATALNQIAKVAYDKDYKWFLTLDQDSECSSDMVIKYKNYIDNDQVGMICPTIHLRIHGNKTLPMEGYEYVDTAITSGSMVRTEAWRSVGGFWDYLFIDKVDDDFCYSIREHNWKILKSKEVILEHQIGNPSIRKFLWKSYFIDSYPSFRYYYIARNNIIVYYCHKNTGYHSSRIIILKLVKILFGENLKMLKLREYLRGVLDGIKWILFYKGKKDDDTVI